MDDRPCKSDSVTLESSLDGFRIVHDQETKKYFRLGVAEADYLESLIGERTVDDLRAEGGRFAPEQVDRLIAWFEDHQLLRGSAPAEASEPVGLVRRAVNILTFSDQLRVTIANPDALLDRHRRAVDAMFSRPALALYLLVFLAPAWIYIVAPQSAAYAVQTYALPNTILEYIVLYLMFAVMIFFHEMAHAVTCKHFGGRVEKIGLMIFFLQPVFYCDVSDAWRFRSSQSKVAVAAAGIFFQSVLSAVAVVAWMATGLPLLATFAIISTVVALFNFFPFVKMDGYWMLVHAMGEPHLRKKGFAAVDQRVRRLIGRSADGVAARPAILAYGLGAVVAVPLFWILGLSGIYRYGSKLSPTLAAVAVAVLAAVLLLRALKGGVRYVRNLDDEQQTVAAR